MLSPFHKYQCQNPRTFDPSAFDTRTPDVHCHLKNYLWKINMGIKINQAIIKVTIFNSQNQSWWSIFFTYRILINLLQILALEKK